MQKIRLVAQCVAFALVAGQASANSMTMDELSDALKATLKDEAFSYHLSESTTITPGITFPRWDRVEVNGIQTHVGDSYYNNGTITFDKDLIFEQTPIITYQISAGDLEKENGKYKDYGTKFIGSDTSTFAVHAPSGQRALFVGNFQVKAGTIELTSAGSDSKPTLVAKGGKVVLDAQTINITNQGYKAIYVPEDDAYVDKVIQIQGFDKLNVVGGGHSAIDINGPGETTIVGSKDSTATIVGNDNTKGAIDVGMAGNTAYAGKFSIDVGNLEVTSNNSAGIRIQLGEATIAGDTVTIFGKDNALTVGDSSTLTLAASTQGTVGKTTLNGSVDASNGTVNLQNQEVTLSKDSTFKAKTVGGTNGTLVYNSTADDAVMITEDVQGFAIMQAAELADQYDSPEEAYAAYQKQVNAQGGYQKGGLSGTTGDGWRLDENGNPTVNKNESLASFGSFNGMTFVQWRNEINSLHERLGDVRDGTQIGAWARVYGSESKIKDTTTVDVDSTTIQVGGDGRIDNWLIGAAFAYTDLSSEFSNGSGESDGYTLSAYATGKFACGGFVDLIARVGRLSSDITSSAGSHVDALKASYDNTALSLSAEVGYNYPINDIFFVEPQAELTYGVIFGDDFRATNGVKIEQDDFQTLVGRLGARLGATFAEGAGRVFLTASVNHDFLGDADYTATPAVGKARQMTNDLGGTWFTYGVGANFVTDNNLSFYGTLERTNGSDFQQNFKYSVGMSYRF